MSTSLWEPIELPGTWQGPSEPQEAGSVRHRLPVDVIETPQHYIVQAVLPGAHPEDIEVSTIDHTLIIHAMIRELPRSAAEHMPGQATHDTISMSEHGETALGANYLQRERFLGEMTRTLGLPWNAGTEHIEATYEYGLLVLWIPKSGHVTPRRIAVYPNER